MKRIAIIFCLIFALSGCGSAPAPTAVKIGKPYTVEGQSYTPQYDVHYDKIGMASWYGPGFHGGKTANGERFDQDDLTAASPTLPLPSMVRVTNLANGKSAVVRINDRGPFKDNRIIDLSRASAQTLGITGLQRVRVEYLKEESEAYWAQMHLNTSEIQFAQNDPYAPPASSQVKSSAPVTSVAAADLKPEDLKFRPLQPHFRVIEDAQAQESNALPVASGRSQEEESTPDETPPPKVVKLVHKADHPKIVHPDAAPVVADKGSSGKWFIQAGSFMSEENARKLATRLQGLASVDVKPVQVSDQTWHRVRVGPFADREAAAQALEKVMSQGAPGARIVGD